MDGEGVVMQEFAYYPYGLQIQELSYLDTTMQNPFEYSYNGKEEWDEFGLDWLNYGARMYDPVIARFHSVDPMAHMREWVSPYNFVQNNPINRIDPTGALDDNYSVDDQGNVKLEEKTDDDFDMLYTKKSWDSGTKDKSIKVDKGVLNSSRTNTVTGSNGKDYTFDQYDVTGDDKAKGLFEFVGDNTNVEWSLTGVGAKSGAEGKNILTTSHIKNSEIGGGYLKAYGYTIRKHSHSHPFSNIPSTSDRNFAKLLNLKFPKATLDIYHKGEYFQYDKSGLISIPTINLPEIEIKAPKND